MGTRYHINGKGQKAVCHASKRACRYSQHMDDASSTPAVTDQASLLKSMDALNQKKLPPTTIPNSPLREPSQRVGDTDVFEFYEDPWYPDSYISNPSITFVDMEGMLAEIHGCPSSDITPEYVEYARSIGLDKDDAYEVERTYGYYDEVYTEVTINDGVHSKLLDHYYAEPNAVDHDGVLLYCRGKGFDTTGFTPVEALKAQLSGENGHKPHPRVDVATRVRRQSLDLSKIIKPATQHYSTVDPRPAAAVLPGGEKIYGVVVDNKNGTFNLVDGYHRMKALEGTNRKSVNVFILSECE